MTHVNTVVIGAGQGGLCVSYYLTRDRIEHVVLEKNSIGESWRRRWDSFTLVTPNRLNALPNFPSGGDPDGFLTRAEVIQYLERFAESFGPPLLQGVRVTQVVPRADDTFVVETDLGAYICRNVVVATNIFQNPQPPSFANLLPPEVDQLHSAQYRNPDQIRSGAVLVVGSGQSGSQIAEELHLSGRKVHLAVSRAGRLPRRYRDRDIMDWIRIFRGWERTVDQLESPADRVAARPHVTGRGGGRTLNLRRFGREGMGLLGKVAAISDGRIYFERDLKVNLRKADEFAEGLCAAIDMAIDKTGLEAPPPTDDEIVPETWNPPETIRELSVEEAGIETVIWATGYPFNFDWITGVALDRFGYPVHKRGVTSTPGLYFASLPWLHKHKSCSLYGAGEDAEHVALSIVERSRG